jgi:hypothetical protein
MQQAALIKHNTTVVFDENLSAALFLTHSILAE